MGLWLWSSSPSQAGVAVDGVGSYATLTEAVAAAPLGGSTLTVDAGTLVEPGSVEIPADKTPMVIEGAGPTTVVTGPTTVVRTYGDVTLRGMTLQSAANGGVRTLDDGNLVLEDLTILLDGTGSGVVTGGDSLTMTRVTIYGVPGVTTAVYGGGVDAGGTFDPIQVTLTDVRLVDTSATYSGGGIDLDNAVFTCDRCVFERTTASTGGGIHATDTAATIVRSRFCGTSAGTTGGAIAAVAEEDQWLESSLRNTLIAQSTADSGGAVYVLGGVWTLVNNHFVENTGLGAVQTLTQRAYVHLFDNLFLSNTGYAVRLGLPTAFPVMERNWMYDNGDEVWNFTDPWPGTNVVGVDPMVSGDLTDCLTAELWPTPAVSGLIDAGDPLLLDLDGTPADVGAYGGPDAGPGVDATHPKYADGDGDGFVYLADCDDADPTSFPSPETCDGADNDCDGAVDDADPDLEAPTWAPDCDGDGWGAGDGWVTGCAAPAGGCPFVDATADLDCDDQDPTAAALWIAYLDADGDELGDPASPVEACGAEPGQVANADDCDDTSAALGVERTGYPDADADGFGVEPAATYCDGSSGFADVAGDCDDLASDVFPGAVEACDGVDQNCAAGTDDEPFSTFYLDADADGFGDPATATEACAPEAGWVDDGTDCDDGHASAHPGGEQLCDGLDGDCDGTPLGDGPESAWYADVDGDGRGDDATEVTTACPPEGWVSAGGDCDDADPQRSPDLPEVADDGIDQDCDGVDRVSPEPPPADDTGKPEDPSEGCGCAQVEPGSVWLGVAGALLARFTRRRAAAPPAG